MYQYLKTGVAAAALNACTGADNQRPTAMVGDTIQHGRSLKSLMSILFKLLIAFILFLFVLSLVSACCDCDNDFVDGVDGVDDFNKEDIYDDDQPECIPFYSVVIVRWDSNTLTVISNPDNNGGYDFTNAQYQWYYNGRRLRNSTGQSLLRNPDGGMLEAGHYHVEIIYRGGFLVTCMEYCAFENSL